MLKLILGLHIAAGTTALVSMWIPMVARKGAALHRRAGTVFVAAMTVVSLTALALASTRIALDPTPQGRRAGLFLLFVAILTGAAVSSGVRVLRAKQRGGPHLHWWDVGLAALLTIASVAIALYGAVTAQRLFVAFAAVGLLTGVTQLRYWLRPPASPMHWWFEHMSSMMGACIAATTAFFVVNAQRWGLDTFGLLVWLAPTAIGTPATIIWTGYYRRRFEGTRLKAQGSTVQQLRSAG